MMGILMFETCWAYNKYNKITSDIYLVFYSSIITMMHGPINIRGTLNLLCRRVLDVFPYQISHAYAKSSLLPATKLKYRQNLPAVFVVLLSILFQYEIK